MSLQIKGMAGLGDNVYQRPIIRAACERYDAVYLNTPWPELYRDLPVRCIKSQTPLRTQAKNVQRSQQRWEHATPKGKSARMWYGREQLERGTILSALESCIPLRAEPFVFDLPDFGPSPIPGPVAVIRPGTVRSEWEAPARNPHGENVRTATRLLKERGYHTVSVADLDASEWLDGPDPEAETRLHHGELAVTELCALVANAALVVSGVGFMVPMALAYRTPLVVLAGGALQWNGPETVIDPRIDAPNAWVLPDHPCRCGDLHHECFKAVSDFPAKFLAAVDEVLSGRDVPALV